MHEISVVIGLKLKTVGQKARTHWDVSVSVVCVHVRVCATSHRVHRREDKLRNKRARFVCLRGTAFTSHAASHRVLSITQSTRLLGLCGRSLYVDIAIKICDGNTDPRN